MPRLAKLESDGPYCLLVQRRLSAPLSQQLAPRVAANTVTTTDLVVGLGAAGALAAEFDVVAFLLIQAFGVLSCVDGEVARLRGQTTPLGDYFDTMVDRVVELAIVAALTARLAHDLPGNEPIAGGVALLCAVALITLSAEKFRSAFGQTYPKRQLEPVFAWISAGSDARLLAVSVGVFAGYAAGEPRVLLWTAWALAAIVYANLVVRFRVIFGGRGAPEPRTIVGQGRDSTDDAHR